MKYAIGLDIGTTSCGWSVINLEKNRIEDLGVRIFERPENPKNGQSLALPRRTARSARRRLRRRRVRLNYLKDFFIKHQLLTKEQISNLYENNPDPYVIRKKGQSQKLTETELYIALHHIAKRRGYKTNRKSIEENDTNSESKKVLSAIADNKQLIRTYGNVACALNDDDKFSAHKRNKRSDYSNSFIREDFLAEIQALLTKQQEFYPALTDSNIQDLLMSENKGLFYQRPFMNQELVNKMRGNCQFEKEEPRIHKASYTFELFRLAEELAHITFNTGEKLTPEQIMLCVDKAKSIKKGLSYANIRDLLGAKDSDDFHFDYMRGKIYDKDKKEIPEREREKTVFVKMPFYHEIKTAFKNLPDEWGSLAADNDKLDDIGFALTANKDDKSLRNALKELNLSEDAIDAIMNISKSFSGFGHLSRKALNKITPFILSGMTYDKAVEAAGYNFGQKFSGDKNKLPPLNEDQRNQVTNPVAKRAISQTIKVVNAIITKYGAPSRICLECANDLAKSPDERKKIKDAQDERAEFNSKIVKRLQEDFHVTTPTGKQITKFKLYMEQDGKCLYSGQEISLERLFSDDAYCEIDHIIPFSRCGNDSLSNKVLVLNAENQEKGNSTPFEAWGQNKERWSAFVARVNSNPKIAFSKKKRLLAEKLPKEDWNIRALNDTRYISRFMAQFLRDNLHFADDQKGVQKVFTPTGNITHFLRSQWHIGHKNREEDNLHHAVDATIIALVTQGKIKECANLNKWRALGMRTGYNENFVVEDKNTGESINVAEYRKLLDNILPWPNFDHELRMRASQPKPGDGLEIWRDQFREIYKDQDEVFRTSIRPIFVSRMPKRNGTGAIHQDTIRSPKHIIDPSKTSYIRKNLTEVKLKDLEESSIKLDDKVLYEQLRTLLEQNDDNPKKAFASPVYKGNKTVDKNGNSISPVTTIKVNDNSRVKSESGILINHNTQYVNNGSMVRIDIYAKNDEKGNRKHYIVPIYTYQVKKGSVRVLPCKGGIENIDKSFDFIAKVYPNDYLRLKFDTGEVVEGYYVKYNIASGAITLISPTSPDKKTNLITPYPYSAIEISRFDISVLGDNYPWE